MTGNLVRAWAEADPGRVEVVAWWLDAAPAEVEALRALLSEDERSRAGRFAAARDRDRFVVGRARLRQLLGSRCGRAPGAVRFAVAEGGKPSVAGEGRLRFNAAHSHDLMLCALAADREVGADVERVRPDFDWEDLARRFLAADEVRALVELPPARARDAFFACWTRKEAIVKATGEGLARPLGSFAVSVDSARASLLSCDPTLGRPEDWSLVVLPLPPAYQGAVAARGPVTLRLSWWSEPSPSVADSRPVV